MIMQWFQEEDARKILNISLPSSPTHDSWLWLPETSGKFSVKSAYRVLKNHDPSSETERKWKIIWGTSIHNRLKMMWWKILSNFLPTKDKLSSFTALPDTKCPLCDAENENTFHLFWECNFARITWLGSRWELRPDTFHLQSWEEWLLWFSKGENKQLSLDINHLLEGAAVILEHIWRERNKRIHEGRSTPTELFTRTINSRLGEMNALRDAPIGLQTEWKPPPLGWISCSIDVSIGNTQSTGAIVLRDHTGTILKIITFQTNCSEVLPGETHAVCKRAEAVIQMGYNNVIFQCDSTRVVEALNPHHMDILSMHFNIQELARNFSFLAGKLNLCEVQWIPRDCNGVAHAVARWANRNNRFGTFDLSNFDDFLQHVAADGRVDL
ncbi:hypothetical protein CsatA_006542 [Cannabis sativa]